MKTCLVVDDSKVVRMVARKILEELGFDVSEAEDGQVALDMSMERVPDVVLLDWNMPIMSGIEYLRALRVTEEGKRPVVVFCTTENDLSHI
jgi:two-component system chemotaxis response regulator CheY